MIKSPKPDDFAAWEKVDVRSNSKDLVRSQKIISLYKPNITYKKIGGVNVVDIKPKNWSNNGKILVYLHGGGYTQLSANSTAGNAVLVSNASGLRVIMLGGVEAYIISHNLPNFPYTRNLITYLHPYIRNLVYLLIILPTFCFLFIVPGGLLWITLHTARKEFRFYFAKACFIIISKEKDDYDKIKYLIMGLNSYNKYLRRRLKLEIKE